MSDLIERLKVVQSEIAKACERASRDPREVCLVCISKGKPESSVLELFKAGILNFGENRVVEAKHKQENLPTEILWHFIGSFQSNKVRKIVGKYTLIHSIDSFELAEKISKVSQEESIVTSCLIQVNTSGELVKHGLSVDEVREKFHKFIELPNILIRGLMTMGPKIAKDNTEHVRKAFSDLRNLKFELNCRYPQIKPYFKELSMGMSQDFEIAIEEGATILRIGSLIFSD